MVDFPSGLRRRMAMPSASTTSSVFWLVSIDQPMMRRVQASMTAAQYSFPSAVGCSVMSVSHSRSRPVTVNCAVYQVLLGRGVDQVLPAFAAVDALQPVLAHQPGDPLAVHRLAQAQHQLGMHPRPAVRARDSS